MFFNSSFSSYWAIILALIYSAILCFSNIFISFFPLSSSSFFSCSCLLFSCSSFVLKNFASFHSAICFLTSSFILLYLPIRPVLGFELGVSDLDIISLIFPTDRDWPDFFDCFHFCTASFLSWSNLVYFSYHSSCSSTTSLVISGHFWCNNSTTCSVLCLLFNKRNS
uniref:Uncharacterized protein n=1 Tax=Cacopsylla melanoneura TaxID=428564 RepID=A0A8D9EJ86_9HEMI